ncbi:MAG: serine protease [Myxococcales bacterium]|nr:serine protease [Myxococcales bacterium]
MPEACTNVYSPVCGCDDNTYSSACYAHLAGVSVATTGPCKKVVGEGDWCGGNAIEPQYCAQGLFCDYTLEDICGFADAAGKCRVAPQACTKEYKPVCGCNGKTYGNKCTANSLGVSIQSIGPCPGDTPKGS